MDFFRKLFPIITKKNKAEDTNEYNHKATEISVGQCQSQVDIHLNILESNVSVTNNTDNATSNDSVTYRDDLDCNKILHTLENVAPIEIGINDVTHNEPNEINDEFVSEDAEINDATEVDSVRNAFDVSSSSFDPRNKKLEQLDVSHDLELEGAKVINDLKNNTEPSTPNNVIDDETMQSFKEFEEALNNFDKTALITNDFDIDIINLDEFNEILFDNLDTVNEDLNSEDDSIKSTVRNNNENTNSSIIDRPKTNSENCIDSKVHPNINENIDVITINSSTEDEKCLTQDISLKDIILVNSGTDESDSICDGYNSSDFEFISEAEAKTDGFIINFRRENYPNLSQASSEQFEDEGNYLVDGREASDPGEGPSRLKNPFEDRSYRDNHHIPEGEDYLGLFQGIYNPLLPMSEIYFLENKSVRASAMNSQYDGMGFDRQLALRRHQPDSSEDEFEDEAKECVKKIFSMYPGENRKRRRRY